MRRYEPGQQTNPSDPQFNKHGQGRPVKGVSYLVYFISLFASILLTAFIFNGFNSTRNSSATDASSSISGDIFGDKFSDIFGGSKESKLDYSKLNETYDVLKGAYLEDVTDEELLNGAIQGMVEATGDPYTQYMISDTRDDFNENIEGSFQGIGAEIMSLNNNIVIVSPLKDAPAEKAGLLANDIILKANETELAGMSADEAVKIIRGEKGTTVTLEILRGGQAMTVAIVRDEIPLHTVNAMMDSKNPKVGIIEVTQFGADTYNEFVKAIKELDEKGAESFVLDLRNNPGGLMDQAIKMANIFLEDGDVILQTEDKEGTILKYAASAKDYGEFRTKKPIVVLINDGSASASEILAAALSENLNTPLVGSTSFGKGVVQSLIPLDSSSDIKVTTSKWLTPKGNWIHEKGIKPTEEIGLNPLAELPLIDSSVEYKVGDNNGNVITIEKLLSALGYFKETPDSVYNEETKNAVSKFQEAVDLDETGVVDGITNYNLTDQTRDYLRAHDKQLEAAVDFISK